MMITFGKEIAFGRASALFGLAQEQYAKGLTATFVTESRSFGLVTHLRAAK